MHSDTRQALLEEFPELASNEIVLQKEVYAHFGLAFFKFALVEHSLINIAVFSTLGEKLATREIRNRTDWEAAFDAAEAKAVALTFGNLLKMALKVPEFGELNERLRDAKRLRDYFAHHFMREEAGYFGSDEGCWLLLSKIRDVRMDTISLEGELKTRSDAMCKRIGIPRPSENDQATLLEGYRNGFEQALSAGTAKMGWEKHAL